MDNYPKTLNDLVRESQSLTELLFESGGEMTPEVEEKMSMNGLSIREKLDAYGFVIDAMKMRNEYAIHRMKEWEKAAVSCEKSLDNIKSRIIHALSQMEIPEMHGHEYTFKLQANPPACIVDNEDIIPGEFITTETKVINKIDKKAILAFVKDGGEVPGCHVERSTRLVTKVSQRKDLNIKSAIEVLK